MENTLKKTVSKYYPLTPRDAGEYNRFAVGPAQAALEWFTAEGLGNLCLLRTDMPGGVMTMQTAVLTPLWRDLPLFSFDLISVPGKSTLLVEFYDILLTSGTFCAEKLNTLSASLSDLPVYDTGKHWYDGIRLPCSVARSADAKENARLENTTAEMLEETLRMASSLPLLSDADQEKKREKAKAYVDGLLSNDSPSMQVFGKALGKARAADLYRRIVFGVAK